MKKSDVKKLEKQYVLSDGKFYPGKKMFIFETLPAGAYTCNTTPDGQPYLTPFTIKSDEIINMPGSVTDQVVKEVRQYWSEGVSQKFKQYGLVQKRGVLLHGIQGTGKSITLNAVARMAQEELDAVTLFNPHPYFISDFVDVIRQIEPNKKIIIMLEEFEEMLNKYESTLLSILDGQIQVENVLYLATTNYITQIPARIKNRPSRFAKVIEFTAPDEATRRQYLKQKLHESDQHHLEPMVKLTQGFVLDQLKDIIVSVCCFEQPINEAVHKIKEMNSSHSLGLEDAREAQNYNALTRLEKELENIFNKTTPERELVNVVTFEPPKIDRD